MSITSIERGGDRWKTVRVTWEEYLALVREELDRSRPKYTFVDGRLTIVSPSYSHDDLRVRLTWFVDEILLGLMIDGQPAGETTLLKEKGSRAGTEGDATYYLTNIDKIRGKTDFIMGDDPPPDLAIEIVWTHPVKDALEAYRRIGVREVWVCRKSKLEFLVLSPKRQYRVSRTSACLPFLRSDDLTPWVYREDLPSETQLRHLFRLWVTETLAPRYHALK
jgi:Uma2 family endonuclease